MAAKRMKNDPATASGDDGLDMTPMIDVTFQLIIFFMCVTDVANNAKERLQLPIAREAEADMVEPGRLVINVNKEGAAVIMGQTRTDADLRAIFRFEAQTGPKVNGLPDKAVYIRADKNTDYRYVERIMALAQEVLLWRVMFSTGDPEKLKYETAGS